MDNLVCREPRSLLTIPYCTDRRFTVTHSFRYFVSAARSIWVFHLRGSEELFVIEHIFQYFLPEPLQHCISRWLRLCHFDS